MKLLELCVYRDTMWRLQELWMVNFGYLCFLLNVSDTVEIDDSENIKQVKERLINLLLLRNTKQICSHFIFSVTSGYTAWYSLIMYNKSTKWCSGAMNWLNSTLNNKTITTPEIFMVGPLHHNCVWSQVPQTTPDHTQLWCWMWRFKRPFNPLRPLQHFFMIPSKM